MATRMFDRRPAAALGDPGDRVASIVARHGELLIRVARSYSLCADDAQDAVQRALEIYMRRVESLDPATELAWLKVVVKHESLAVRRARAGVSSEEVDLDAVPALSARSVEERAESAERVERSAEVMRRLKRDEARALMLKAEGLSYVEIGERLGWTYTKVNRCITEGRRRFMQLYEELETGAECERLAPVLVALAAGEASSDALLEIRPHLRNCPACRATVRDLHASRLRRLTAWVPLGAIIAPARAFVERFRSPRPDEAVELHPMQRAEQLDEAFRRLNAGDSAVQPLAPSVAEGVERVSGASRLHLRDWVEAALQRLQSSDLAIGVHAATSSGGGRISAIAALIGICVSGAGAGTYCVATALLPGPKPAIHAAAKPSAKRKNSTRTARGRASQRRRPIATSTPAPAVTSTPRPSPAKRHGSGNAQTPEAGQTDEFSFESGTGATSAGATSTSATAASSGPANAPNSSDGSFESGATTASGGEINDGAGGEFSP